MKVDRSEFFTSKDGDIILITGYVPEEREKLIQMYEDFSSDKRCCGLPPVRKKMIEEWIDGLSEGYMFIAKHGERIIGHIGVMPQGEKAEFVIFIQQDYKGKWIGGELIKFAEKFLKDEGIRILEAVTERGNMQAIQLYLWLGFKIAKSDEFYVYLKKDL
ncbi:GNAT family N-acetyltransferase [Archaeoglobales archaeon]|nr:MAG: GNAT family N-acetyltransferase [Archaeoglobales archaeon]